MGEQDNDREKAALLAWVNHQRQHAITILEGLREEDLRRPILPSGWNCLEMIAHLAALERSWYRAVVVGDPAASDAPDDEPGDWRVPADMPASAVFAAYQRGASLADDIIAATQLDAPSAWWPTELFGEWRLDRVREIVLHTMTETASHTGHLDAARELIDGRLWLVLET